MKNCFTLLQCNNIFILLLLALGACQLNAQTTNNQTIATQCYSGPTQSFNNTTGTVVGNVTFPIGVGANEIPAGHRIVDVIVEVVWSKSDLGSCTPPTGLAADLSHVGFKLRKTGGPAIYLAASAATAASTSSGPTTASFSGTFAGSTNGILFDTITFRDNSPSLLPSGIPNTANDTFQTNNDSLNFFCGQNPTSFGGMWVLEAIDDAPTAGPSLCVHSYCVTLVTCDPDTLVAACKATPDVALDASGIVVFQVADLDSASDVSCLLKDVTISPFTANCSNIGTPLPVTMTFRDHLDSVASCTSIVNIVDTLAPVIADCSPATWGTLYLDATGQNTFLASSLTMTDNCGFVLQQVAPFSGTPAWSSQITFNCVTGTRQFLAKGTDSQGNADSCRIRVVVLDTVPPTALCGRDTAYLTTAGIATVDPANIDAGSFDVCPPITGRWIGAQFAPLPTYTCADIGSDTVMLIVSDQSGNLDTCNNAIITILDTIAPNAICATPTVYLNASGSGTLLAAQVDNNSFDTCGIDSIDINNVASINFDCSHTGTAQSVTLHVFDPSGNVDSCVAMVNVIDTFPPTAICQNLTAYLDGSVGGNVTIVADSLNNNSMDVCTGMDLSFQIAGNNTANFTCADLGANTVVLTVLDSFGNSNTCNSTVTIVDTIAPNAICAIPTVYLTNAGTATVTATQLNNLSTDNCSIANLYVNTIGVTSTNFTCSAINTPQNVTLIVQDASGNTSSCATTVTVLDTITPTALCEFSYTAQLNGSGNATVTPANIDSLSNDNCGLGVSYFINGLPSQNYTCADVGTITAILTIEDSSGNSASCNANIIIEDNTPPVAACQTTTVYLDAAGNASITPSDVLNGASTSDNCTSITATFLGGATNISYDCNSLSTSPNNVTVVVSDASGNTASCATTVTVLDTVPPVAICRSSYTVQLDATGTGFIVPMNIDNGSSDICGIDTMFVNGVDSFFYNCANAGNTAATLSVLDESGNTATCVTSINVSDPTPPTAICHDTTLYLNASGVASALPSDIDAGSTDNCNLSLSINGAPVVNYNCSNIGTNTAFLTASDGSNSDVCSASITVLDTISPTANCTAPGAVTLYVPAGQCFRSTPASTFNSGSTDNCSASLTYRVGGFPNVTLTNLGVNNITLTVRDGSGNTSTCNTTAILLDTIRPTMVCKPDTIQLDNNGAGIVLPFNVNDGSTDNCGTPTLTINGNSSWAATCARLGNNTVQLIGSDASGNRDSCAAQVVVQDLIAPNALCNPNATVVLDGTTGNGTLLVSQVDNSSTDNCTISSYTLSQTNFSCADIGNNPHNITLTVTDQSGNSSQCNSSITVVDTVSPAASCVGTITRVLAGSSVSITSADINNGSTDNCAIQSYTLSQSTFNCANVGPNNVIMTVTDSSGNSSTCVSTVIIQDNTNPVPSCTNITVQLDATGNISVAATDIGGGSFDNCSIDTILVNGLDSAAYDCSDIGLNIANIYIQDPSGNPATCTATINVVDNQAPTATCTTTPITLQLDASGNASITTADVNNGSSDNCTTITPANLSLSKSNFTCADVSSNPNTVTLTVTDASGNSSTCNSTVNVFDTIKPNMVCQADTVYLSSGGLATVLASNFDGGTTDACGLASLSFVGAPNPVGCADIGVHNITLTANDVNGNSNSCTTTLTVLDTVPPTLNCTDDTLNLDGLGNLTVDASTNSIYSVSDACGAPSLTFNGVSSINYSCTDVGPNNVSIVATDASGNSSTCVSVVTVADVTPPSPSCTNSTVQYLDVNGLLAVDPNWILASVIEPCGIDTIFATLDTLNCSHVGPINSITITVIDSSGNSNTCSANLPVEDTIAPTMVCRDTTVSLTGAFVNVNAADIDGGTTDACGLSPGMTINNTSNVIYTCANIGTQVAVLERRDNNGNIDTCHAMVTVVDDTPPNAVCQPYTASVGANGLAVVHALQDIEFGSNDNCGLDSTSFRINGLDSLTYTCAFIGNPDTVQFTVADQAGNIDTCLAIITIEDVMNPTARCTANPINRVLPPAGFVTVQAFDLNSSSTPSSDNCSLNNYLINGQALDSFDCSHLGMNTVVLTVIDGSNNSDTCHAQVNVQDLTQPTVSCVFTTNLILDTTGQVSLPAANLVSSASDNCGIASIMANGQDTILFTCDSIGSNLMAVTVIDSSGNTANCSAVVNVIDNIDPVAICPSVTIYLTGVSNGATYVQANEIDSGSYDNCGIVRYLINNQDSFLFSCNNIPTSPTNAVLTVIDSSGNSSTCNATVLVIDTIPPTARCRDIVVQLDNSGVAYVSSSAIDSFSFDNCNVSSTLINGLSRDTFDCSNVGSPNNAVLSVFDLYGNVSYCTASVTVLDVTNPTINCPGALVDVFVNNNGIAIVDPQNVAIASDTCSILYWYINGQGLDTFDCATIGSPQLVTISVEDPSGNSASCSALLNVRDTIAPDASCQGALSIALDSTGEYRMTWADIDFFSSDNCGLVDTLINGQNSITYTCDSVPNSPLTAIMTLRDASGNTSTCSTTINLVDNIFPTAQCRDTVFVQLDNTPNAGLAVVQAISLDNGSSDACSPLQFLISNLGADTFRCQNVGNPNPRILTVTDANGNSSTCISQIEVSDVDPPTVICQDIDAYLSSSGTVVVTATQVDGGSFDNCAIFSTTFNTGSSVMNYTCADTGVHTVTLVVSDIRGNIDSCTAIVTIRDTIAPTLFCQNGAPLVVDLTNNGTRILTPSDIGTATDNCTIDSLWLSKDTISCTDLGRIPITLYAIDQNGNQGSCTDTIEVTLDRPTIITPIQDTVLCEGDALPLAATNPSNGLGYTRQWISPNGVVLATTNTTTVTNVQAPDDGWYIFTITPTSGNGCPASDSVNLDVNLVPEPVLATASTVCDGDTALLYLANAANYSGTNFTYEWFFNGNPYAPNPANDSLTITPATAANNGLYSMIITVDGCTDTSAVPYAFSVISLPTPPAPFANQPCEGQVLTLFSNPTDSTRMPYTYQWDGNTTPVFSSILPNPTRANAVQGFAGAYTVTITDGDGCSSAGTVNLTIRQTPVQPAVFYTQPFCVGDILELQDTTVYNNPPIVYSWELPNGDTTSTAVGQLLLNNAASGVYSLTVTAAGCSSIPDTQSVNYEPIPMATDDLFTVKFRDSLIGIDIVNNDVYYNSGFILNLIDTSLNSVVVLGSNGAMNYTPNGGFFGQDTFTYSICDAQCPNSCDTAMVLIDVTTDFECFIPNGISPNGDGVNDNIIVRCRHTYPNAVMEIFSRWGTLVYKGAPTGWDGKFNGSDVPDGTYFYVLKLNDTTYVGTSKDKGAGRVGDQYTGYIIIQR